MDLKHTIQEIGFSSQPQEHLAQKEVKSCVGLCPSLHSAFISIPSQHFNHFLTNILNSLS